MKVLRLSRACRRACQSLPADFDETRGEILALYEQRGVVAKPTLDVECALFVHWCTEIGLRNAKGGFIDRWLARQTLEHSLGSIGQHLPQLAPMLPRDPVAFYRQRYREALYRIHNIYVRQSGDGRLETPLTPRLSRHFLHHTAQVEAASSRTLIESMHRLLSGNFERHVARILADGE